LKNRPKHQTGISPRSHIVRPEAHIWILVMEWTKPFIVYRLNADNKLEEVFHAEDLKKAKYWLTYIAKPGDVLCKTPVHPKHSKQTKSPEYWCHKEETGQPSSEAKIWEEWAKKKTTTIIFPEEQQSAGE